MERVPIACTLSASDGTNRIEEWRQFVARDVVGAERIDNSVRFALRDSDEAVLHCVDLSRREKACCRFFDFRLELLSDGVWLEVGAPEDAGGILDGLFALRASDGARSSSGNDREDPGLVGLVGAEESGTARSATSHALPR